MNIAYAKIGKAIKFKSKFTPGGGDNETSAVIKALANNNPQDTFYIIGRSDFNKLSEVERLDIFPYDNVVNAVTKSVTDPNDFDDPAVTQLIEYFKDNNISIDATVLLVGQMGSVSIPGRIEKINGEGTARVLEMTAGYVSHITRWLNDIYMDENQNNIPIIEVMHDPRYTLAQARDLAFTATKSLSQYDYEYPHKTIKDYDSVRDRTLQKVKATYSEMEIAFLVDREFPENAHKERKRKFTQILHESSPSRYPPLKDWVLDFQDDVEVYGKWTDKRTEGDSRFKGTIFLDDVQEIMSDTRYVMMFPPAKGWVTSKYIEMLYAGCLPFLHPTYDDQKHLEFLPEMLRPKSPKELYETIELLEKYPEKRNELVEKLQRKIFTEDTFTGKKLSTIIMSELYETLDKEYVEPVLSEFESKKKVVNKPVTLDDLFS